MSNGWFENSRDLLIPIIKEMNKLLHKAKLNGRDTRSNVKNVLDCDKGKWIENLVYDINRINSNPKMAWDNVKILIDGCVNHHVKNNGMKFKEDNGVLETSDAENAFLVANCFEKVFNRDADVD